MFDQFVGGAGDQLPEIQAVAAALGFLSRPLAWIRGKEMSEVTLRIESNIEAPARSRSHLAALKPRLEPRYDDVLLIVSELVTNSVRHSGSDDIALNVSSIDGHIRVEVSDGGPGFTRESPRGEGMGLTLVEKLADRWGLVSGERFTVWVELNL